MMVGISYVRFPMTPPHWLKYKRRIYNSSPNPLPHCKQRLYRDIRQGFLSPSPLTNRCILNDQGVWRQRWGGRRLDCSQPQHFSIAATPPLSLQHLDAGKLMLIENHPDFSQSFWTQQSQSVTFYFRRARPQSLGTLQRIIMLHSASGAKV